MISVIVPIYNVEKYLRDCLDSIVNQTYSDLEIILVNDGSTDGSELICKEYEKKDFRIKLYSKKNGGLSSARNFGLKYATGEYISFVDSDDFIELDFYASIIPYINENVDIVCMNYFIFNNKITYKKNSLAHENYLSKKEALELLCKDDIIMSHAWDKVYKADLWKGILFPEGKNYEDIYVMHKVFERAERFLYYNEPKYYYRQRNDSISGNYSEKNLLDNFYGLYCRLCDVDDDLKKSVLMSFFGFFKKNCFSIKITNKLYKKDLKDVKRMIYSSCDRLSIKEKILIKRANKNVYINRLLRKLFKFKRTFKLIRNKKKTTPLIFNVSKEKHIFYFGFPEYKNLGDIAIGYASIKYFVENFPDYKLIVYNEYDTNYFLKKIKRSICDKDLIVVQGGGNFADIYKDQQLMRKKILKAFPNNKIVNMPVSVIYKDENKMSRDLKCFNNHKNFTLLCREEYSYKMIKTRLDNVYLTPDIVMTLNFVNHLEQEKKALFLMRNDNEKGLSVNEELSIKNIISRKGFIINNGDTILNNNIDIHNYEFVVNSFISFICNYSLIITDRLHGAILAMDCGIPCIVLTNNNHKIKYSYQWMKKCNYIYYVENLDEIAEIIDEIKNIKPIKYDFLQDFNLKEII